MKKLVLINIRAIIMFNDDSFLHLEVKNFFYELTTILLCFNYDKIKTILHLMYANNKPVIK
ncbi:hypothetical protein COL61_26060 [Bacillus wiedmannii]|nr:hypothetical protein COL61_26060 [Bacillus wiedmannii]